MIFPAKLDKYLARYEFLTPIYWDLIASTSRGLYLGYPRIQEKNQSNVYDL